MAAKAYKPSEEDEISTDALTFGNGIKREELN